jgi:hypothetical protein
MRFLSIMKQGDLGALKHRRDRLLPQDSTLSGCPAPCVLQSFASLVVGERTP